MVKSLILIGLGGGLGSIFRYLTSLIVNRHFQSILPWGTFLVNIIGCLIIGILIGLFEKQQLTDPDLKLLFITGFCGGYTTFSAFAAENLSLFQTGNTLAALIYTGLSITISLLAVYLGFTFTR